MIRRGAALALCLLALGAAPARAEWEVRVEPRAHGLACWAETFSSFTLGHAPGEFMRLAATTFEDGRAEEISLTATRSRLDGRRLTLRLGRDFWRMRPEGRIAWLPYGSMDAEALAALAESPAQSARITSDGPKPGVIVFRLDGFAEALAEARRRCRRAP